MSWYKGRWVNNRPVLNSRTINTWMAESKKDYHFRVRNKGQADKTVIRFVYSNQVKKDRRLYSACRVVYDRYKEYCKQQGMEPLSSRQFKQNMELLGFIYQKHHRFYAGYYSNRVTTAYKNIGLVSD